MHMAYWCGVFIVECGFLKKFVLKQFADILLVRHIYETPQDYVNSVDILMSLCIDKISQTVNIWYKKCQYLYRWKSRAFF